MIIIGMAINNIQIVRSCHLTLIFLRFIHHTSFLKFCMNIIIYICYRLKSIYIFLFFSVRAFNWQNYFYQGSFVDFTRYINFSVMCFNYMVYNWEPQARALYFSCHTLINLIEFVKNVSKIFFWYSKSVVTYYYPNLFFMFLHIDGYSGFLFAPILIWITN